MIDHFQLGFANRTLGYRLPDEEPRKRARRCGAAAAARHPPRVGARALQRLGGDSGLRPRRRRGRRCTGARSRRTCARERRCTCICRARTKACGTKRRSRLEGDHPVRGADRRADVLVRGLPQRDRELRRERLHRRPPRGAPEVRHEESLHRLRPRRGRRESGASPWPKN